MEVVSEAIFGQNIDREFGWMRQAATAGCPVTFLLAQTNASPQVWRNMLQRCETSTREGAPIIPQAFARPVTILFSFQGEHPFLYMPSFARLKDLPDAEKMEALRNPEVRRQILADEDPSTAGIQIIYKQESFWRKTFPMGDPLNYFPDPSNNIEKIAASRGCSPREAIYDLLLENDGRSFLMYAAAGGYADGNRDPLHNMLTNPLTVWGE
jgi:N-acyl-D-aspartate/D-glutamate deacylase